MRLTVFLNNTNVSDAVEATSLTVNKDISSRISTASFTLLIRNVQEVARYDAPASTYDAARYGVDVREMYAIEVKDIGLGVVHFGGQVSRVQYRRESANTLRIQCDCSDYTTILDRTIVPSASFTGQSDRIIIQTIVNTYCPQVFAFNADIAELLPSIGNYEIQSKSVRQVIEEICELSGAEWRVDYYRHLLYFSPSAYPAPFGLSSAPDNVSTFGIDAATEYTRDFIKPVNKCTVIGGFDVGGAQISAVYEDPISETLYGVQAHTIVDREITIATDAILKAQATVAENAYPQESFTLTTYKDGLDIGQSLPVYHGDYNINGNYIIRSMRLQQVTRSVTRYSLDLGVKPPDQVVLLRMLEARTRRSTTAPTALPARGSVTDASIAVSGISAASISSVNTNTLIGAITSTQIDSVNAVAISGVVTADQIGSVNAATINGVIISSQVADNLIDRLGLYADALRPIHSLTFFPPLPDTNYPVGTSIFRKDIGSQGSFYTNAGEIWVLTTGTVATSGKMEFYSIDKIDAGSITGLILAAQIGQVNASAIQGSISASQIGSVNATSISGTVTAGQIGSINAASITIGQVQDSQIGTVGAGKITAGTITATVQINAPTINGGNITINTSAGDDLSLNTGGLSIVSSSNPGNAFNLSSSQLVFSGSGGVGNQRSVLGRRSGGAGFLDIATATGGSFLTIDGALGVSGSAGAITGYINVLVLGLTRRIPFYA